MLMLMLKYIKTWIAHASKQASQQANKQLCLRLDDYYRSASRRSSTPPGRSRAKRTPPRKQRRRTILQEEYRPPDIFVFFRTETNIKVCLGEPTGWLVGRAAGDDSGSRKKKKKLVPGVKV